MMKITKLHLGIAHSLVGVLFLLVGFLSNGAVDVAIHDTYYVIAHSHVFWMLALLFFGFGLIHWLIETVKIQLNRKLSFVHFVLSVLTLWSVLFVYFEYELKSQPRYSDYSVYGEFETVETNLQFNFVAAGILVLFLITQVVFLVSLLVAFVKKINSLT